MRDVGDLLFFQAITTGLIHHRPSNPVQFVQDCLNEVKDKPMHELKWDAFVDRKPSEEAMSLPPPPTNPAMRNLSQR